MKKTIFASLTILIFLLFPFSVFADTNQYNVKNYYIDATVTEKGNLKVQELIVISGNFSYFQKKLEYQNLKLKDYELGNINFTNSSIYNAENIKNVRVYTKILEAEEIISFDSFDLVYTEMIQVLNENKATKGNYYLEYISGGREYTLYYPNDGNTIMFLFSYEIEKAVVMHEDVAELYWTFINKNFGYPIEELMINISLPKKDSELYFWTHGDINSNIETQDNKLISASMKKISKNSTIDIRVLFSKAQITAKDLRESKQKALEEILKFEIKNNKDVNAERKVTNLMIQSITSSSITYLGIIFVLWIYVYFRFHKEHKVKIDKKIQPDLIYDYNIELVDFLVHKDIKRNTFNASLLNLCSKNNIEVKKIKTKTGRIDYRFTYLNNKLTNDTEDYLLDILFHKIGNQKKVTLSQIRKYALNKKTFEQFYEDINDWLLCAHKDGLRQKFFESSGVAIVSAVLMFILAVLEFFIAVYYNMNFILCYLILPISIIYLFYTLSLKKKSKKGRHDYLKWQEIKNYFSLLSKLKKKDLPKESIIEKYYIYSIVLDEENIVKEFIKNSKYSDNTKDQIMIYSELYYKLNDIIEENEMQIKITQKEKTK